MFVCKCLAAPQIITVFSEITMSFRHLGNSWREPQIETMIISRTVTIPNDSMHRFGYYMQCHFSMNVFKAEKCVVRRFRTNI